MFYGLVGIIVIHFDVDYVEMMLYYINYHPERLPVKQIAATKKLTANFHSMAIALQNTYTGFIQKQLS